MRKHLPSHAPGNASVAGLAFAATIAAIFGLAFAPLGGALFLTLLGAAVVTLLVGTWAQARDGRPRYGRSGSSGGSRIDGGGAGYDDGLPPYYATSAFMDNTPSGGDDGQRGCSFDAPSASFSDSSTSYSSDAGSSPGDCGGSTGGGDY
jgi:hypothetical protein